MLYVFILVAVQVALVVKNPPAMQDLRDRGSIPGLGRSPGEGSGNPLQYSFLENPTDRGARWDTVHGITKSWTRLKWQHISNCSKFMNVWTYLLVQSLSRVWLFVTLWTAAHQTSLSITMSIKSLRPSNHLIFCHPLSSCLQSFPASGSFPMNQFFASGDQSVVVSASASVLPMNTQDWSPLGWTGWICLQSKGLSRVFSNTTVPKHQFFGAQLSLLRSFQNLREREGRPILLCYWLFTRKLEITWSLSSYNCLRWVLKYS